LTKEKVETQKYDINELTTSIGSYQKEAEELRRAIQRRDQSIAKLSESPETFMNKFTLPKEETNQTRSEAQLMDDINRLHLELQG